MDNYTMKNVDDISLVETGNGNVHFLFVPIVYKKLINSLRYDKSGKDIKIKDYINKHDLTYINRLNLIINHFLTSNKPIGTLTGSNITADEINEVLNTFHDNKIDKRSIILSMDSKSVTDIYEFVAANNELITIYIKPGFTNFVSEKDAEFKELFRNSLVDYAFNVYGGERAMKNSYLIRTIMSLY